MPYVYRKLTCLVAFAAIWLAASSPALALAPPADGKELLARVKTLVDSGQLLDPALVARVFPGDRTITDVGATQTGACDPGLQRDIKSTRWAFAGWFYNMPTGRPHMPYPAWGPRGRSGSLSDPAGSYLFMDEQFCSDLLHLRDERSGLLSFDDLPGFACLTMGDVVAMMPVKPDQVYDGCCQYSYWPPAHERYAARVTFFFIPGAECLAGVRAEQNEKWGTRYQQARAAFRQCTDVADHKFCATHPPFGWGDGHTQGLMSEFSAKECMGFGRYYREARTPEPRPRAVTSVPSTPCDGK